MKDEHYQRNGFAHFSSASTFTGGWHLEVGQKIAGWDRPSVSSFAALSLDTLRLTLLDQSAAVEFECRLKLYIHNISTKFTIVGLP